MFNTLIVQPIFNLLVFIYALLPGHNFGLAIIIFTVIVRLLLWPLVKKQLHQAKAMRQLQPELKRIKADAKGDRQKESTMIMELYKEREINPFGSIGIIVLQIPILIGLYSGLHRVVVNPHELVSFSYPVLQNLSWMKELAANIHRFDGTLFGVVDLTRAAIGPKGTYWPAMIIVVASALVQYLQTKQLMPKDADARSLRTILKEAGIGKQADQAEMTAAVSGSTRYILPVMIFIFTVNIASGLGLYWFVGGLVAYLQQAYILRQDVEEIETKLDKQTETDAKTKPKSPKTAVLEGEVIEDAAAARKSAIKAKAAASRAKRKKQQGTSK